MELFWVSELVSVQVEILSYKKFNSLLLKIFENWKIISIIINRNVDNYLLFLSSRPLKGWPKINKGGKEGEKIKK